MVTPEITPLHEIRDFDGPLTEARATALIASLGDLAGARVVDIGCGWAEFLLRVVASDPTASGLGVDLSAEGIAHATRLAAARGLADRVTFEVADVARWTAPSDFDVVLNVGSSHAWGGEPATHTDAALTVVRRMLRPGGRALFGECFWQTTPTPEQLAVMEQFPLDQYGTLAELVDVAVAHGFELAAVSQSTLDEWDAYESAHSFAFTTWLAANADSPDAPEVRERAASHRRRWLHGWRGVMGFAYLTLVAV